MKAGMQNFRRFVYVCAGFGLLTGGRVVAKSAVPLQEKLEKILKNQKNEEYKINKNGNCVALENKVVDLVNEEREDLSAEGKVKLAPLKKKRIFRKTARKRSKEMFENDLFSHERPDGTGWQTVFDEEDTKIENFKSRGENIQFGKTNEMPTPQEIFERFKASKSHYKNMMGDFDYIGVGFYCKKVEGQYLWFVTQHFFTYMPQTNTVAKTGAKAKATSTNKTGAKAHKTAAKFLK